MMREHSRLRSCSNLDLSNFTPLSVAAAAASNYSPDEWFQRIVVDCGLLLELLVVQWGRGRRWAVVVLVVSDCQGCSFFMVS